MKILLLGELSAFHKNLKDGLVELGHDVDLISSGDSWKRVSKSDIKLYSNHKNYILNILDSALLQIKNIHNLKNYDVVHIVSSTIFRGLKYGYNHKLLKMIKKKNGKMFMSSCNTDTFVYDYKNELRYNYFDSHIKIDLKGENPYIRKDLIKNNNNIAQLVDGIIPTNYTYAKAHKNAPNLLNTIPLPINTDHIDYVPQRFINDKVTIFHGISREGFKGSNIIIAAMKKLKENYSEDVEIIIDSRLPLDEYLLKLRMANIVIDQVYSYEYAMNALYSMSMGKVVLSGNEPECQKEFGRSDIPVINIVPSVEDIYNKLEKLVLDKEQIIEVGRKSRLFVQDFHNHVKVAQQYIDTWNSVEVKKKYE